MSRRRAQGGFALIFVLWLGALLAVLAAGAVLTARAQVAASDAALAQVRAGALAESGIRRAVLGLTDRQSRAEWDSGLVVDWRFGGGVVRLTVRPENGKLDLNAASEELLVAVVEFALGVGDEDEEADNRGTRDEDDPDVVDRIVDSILDWRDEDDNRRPFGAEAAEYEAAGRPYAPRNTRFASLSELGQVLGVSAATVGRLAPFLTVHGRSSKVSALGATRDMLLALPDAVPEDVDAFLAERDAFLAARAARASGNRREGTTRLDVNLLGPARRFVTGGRAASLYAVRAEARDASGALAVRDVVLRLGGRSGRPFSYLSWSQAYEDPTTPGGGAAK